MSAANLAPAATAFFTHAFGGVIRIELIGEPDLVWVDGRTEPPSISENSPKGVDGRFCLWRIDPLDVPLVLVNDMKRFENGIVSGRLKISGDMSVMMRLEVGNG